MPHGAALDVQALFEGSAQCAARQRDGRTVHPLAKSVRAFIFRFKQSDGVKRFFAGSPIRTTGVTAIGGVMLNLSAIRMPS
jgi:hypothetical protein